MGAPGFAFGVAALPCRGETETGDRHVLATFAGGALVAAIDALGHGPEAARAANVAARTLVRYARESPVALAARCHAEMHGTRGAAMSLASFDWRGQTLSWIAVGNITGVLMHAEADVEPRVQRLLLRGGVVGDRLPELRAETMPVLRGDTLILATDGVREEFTEILPVAMSPEPLAQRILRDYGRTDDDAMVVVFSCDGAV